MAAEISDWASRTLFMASSISLLESGFMPWFMLMPIAIWFSFGSVMNLKNCSVACKEM
jgi:hypothetical protein